MTVPLHNLIGFQRVHLKPGDSKKVRFTVRSEHMMLFDEDGKQKLEPGLFSLTVGGCSPSARDQALGASSPVSAVFNLLFP